MDSLTGSVAVMSGPFVVQGPSQTPANSAIPSVISTNRGPATLGKLCP
jgi:hypothetical protein